MLQPKILTWKHNVNMQMIGNNFSSWFSHLCLHTSDLQLYSLEKVTLFLVSSTAFHHDYVKVQYDRKMSIEIETRWEKCEDMSRLGLHIPQGSSCLEQLTCCFKVTWRAGPPTFTGCLQLPLSWLLPCSKFDWVVSSFKWQLVIGDDWLEAGP